MIDTGCTKTLLPPSFNQYAVGEPIGGKHRIQLGGKKQELVAESQRVVHLPVRDINGQIKIMVENCAISSQARYPLLGWSKRPIIRGFKEYRGDAIRVKGVYGEEFLVPIEEGSDMPVLSVEEQHVAERLSVRGEVAGVASSQIFELGGATDLNPQEVKLMDEAARARVLRLLHSRLAHATGRRLYLTLQEKGWSGIFTEAACSKVQCPTCEILNRRKVRIPSVADLKRETLKAGEIAYQDLIHMPHGIGGYEYASIIVDAHSRRISAKALKLKSEAIDHCIWYINRLQTKNMKVREWRSDNGGEFINGEYQTFLRSKGVTHETGAPYTPQSQGLVERANGTFKRLMGKTLRSLGLPINVWPALVPGVVQSLNNVVHATLGESPNRRLRESGADVLPTLVVGDLVTMVDPQDRTVFEGFFGGWTNDRSASVVARGPQGGWIMKRAHPTALKLLAWSGGGRIPQPAGGRLGVPSTTASAKKAIAEPNDISYEDVDGDEYIVAEEGDICGEEEYSRAQRNTDTVELSKGTGIVAKGRSGEWVVAKVLKDGKRMLQVAIL